MDTIVSIREEKERIRLSKEQSDFNAPLQYNFTSEDKFKVIKFKDNGGIVESFGPDDKIHRGPGGVPLRFHLETSGWEVRRAGLKKKRRSKKRKSKKRRSKKRRSKKRRSKKRKSKKRRSKKRN